MSIPSRLIFVWFGEALPWSAIIAVRSAVRTCRPGETLLVHEGLGEDAPGVAEVLAEPGVRLVDAGARWFEGLPSGGGTAHALYRELTSPTARANLLRLAVLWKVGGVYMDLDTVTVKPMDDLRDLQGFCGLEPVAVPREVARSVNPLRWGGALGRHLARLACARHPRGVGAFRRIEGLYTMAVNNAVVGSRPRNPILTRAFREIALMPRHEALRQYRLGTHLMQSLTGNRSSEDMEVLPAAYFYPLGPDISVHWFRDGSAGALGELVRTETRVVHWYSSVEKRIGVQDLDEAWVRAHLDSAAYARLAEPHLE